MGERGHFRTHSGVTDCHMSCSKLEEEGVFLGRARDAERVAGDLPNPLPAFTAQSTWCRRPLPAICMRFAHLPAFPWRCVCEHRCAAGARGVTVAAGSGVSSRGEAALPELKRKACAVSLLSPDCWGTAGPASLSCDAADAVPVLPGGEQPPGVQSPRQALGAGGHTGWLPACPLPARS